MSEIDTPFTNVTLQTFASEGDMALVNQQWEKLGPKYLERLARMDFCHTKWPNMEQRLQVNEVCIFDIKALMHTKLSANWGEVEKTVFEGAVIKVTAYRGITEEYCHSMKIRA